MFQLFGVSSAGAPSHISPTTIRSGRMRRVSRTRSATPMALASVVFPEPVPHIFKMLCRSVSALHKDLALSLAHHPVVLILVQRPYDGRTLTDGEGWRGGDGQMLALKPLSGSRQDAGEPGIVPRDRLADVIGDQRSRLIPRFL